MTKSVPLPPPCPECSSYAGLWRNLPPLSSAESGVLVRCSCPRGRILAEGKPVRRARTIRVPPPSRTTAGPGWIEPAQVYVHDGKAAACGEEK